MDYHDFNREINSLLVLITLSHKHDDMKNDDIRYLRDTYTHMLVQNSKNMDVKIDRSVLNDIKNKYSI